MSDGLTMDDRWNTSSTGTEQARADLPASGSRVWLRAAADISPGPGRQATFSYSTDGSTFTRLGPAFTMNERPHFFMGYRFAVFNHATKALGGKVRCGTLRLARMRADGATGHCGHERLVRRGQPQQPQGTGRGGRELRGRCRGHAVGPARRDQPAVPLRGLR